MTNKKITISNIDLRNAIIDDMKHVSLLLDQLGYPVSEDNLKERFKRFINNPGNDVVVSILNNTIVGFIAWSTTPLFVSDRSRFHIEALVVNEKL